MAAKIWYPFYPEGVPQEINAEQYVNIQEMIQEAVHLYANRPAYSNMGKTITFNTLDQLSNNFGAYLQKNLGLRPGDRIALMMPNCLQYPVALFGALKAGLVVVNTNPLYTPREMEHQFNDSGATAIVIVENFAANLQKILPNTPIKHIITTGLGDMLSFIKGTLVNFVVKHVKKMVPAYQLPATISFKSALSAGKSLSLQVHKAQPNDLALLQYTGGTTGLSKGAMLSHKNIIANSMQIGAWLDCSKADLKRGQEIIITALPLYHIFAFTVNCLFACNYGMHSILITNPRDMKAFIGELKKYKFSLITGVNTLFNGLLNQPDFASIDFSNLRIAIGGGMAVQRAVAEKWQKVTGCYLAEGYGLTESSPVLCAQPLDGTGTIGTIGLPVPSTDIKIVDDNGNELPLGERGEIIGAGPQIMLGYYNHPEATAEVIKDGWLYTGDIGIMDSSGLTRLVDRKKEMILVSGFNVYPNEIEDVIAMHPQVLEVAVIGVPDAKSGEAVKAYIVKKDDSLTVESLEKHFEDSLTSYKKPKHYEFRTELPKSNIGKILRRLLKEELKNK